MEGHRKRGMYEGVSVGYEGRPWREFLGVRHKQEKFKGYFKVLMMQLWPMVDGASMATCVLGICLWCIVGCVRVRESTCHVILLLQVIDTLAVKSFIWKVMMNVMWFQTRLTCT